MGNIFQYTQGTLETMNTIKICRSQDLTNYIEM